MDFSIDTSTIRQIGILTRDIQEATQQTAAFLNTAVPDIMTSPEYELTRAVYRGQPCTARIYQSFFNLDNVQIELIEPMDDTPSIWLECLQRDGEGMHHVAYEVKNMAQAIADLEAQGIALLQKGEYPGGRYAYLDDRSKRKMIIELLEND
ncbi:MAG: VOC family protein [Eubacteriales bacterium]|nr:VOC family protein [Eubacteriales bacterium]